MTRYAALLGILVSFPTRADAHELSENSARVTLRDGHFEVRVEVDVARWMARLAAVDETRFPAVPTALSRAGVHLVEGTRLVVDGTPVAFDRIRLPDVADAAADLRARRADDHVDRPHRTVVLEAVSPSAAPRRVSVRFPKSLGNMVVNFVQPATHWTTAGAAAEFPVLTQPAGVAAP